MTKIPEKMIIYFWCDSDDCWGIRIFHEENKIRYSISIRNYYFILDVKRLPIQTIPLFDRMGQLDLQTTKALFLLHICKSYLEVYNYD